MFACQFNESTEVLLFILSDIKTAKINCCALCNCCIQILGYGCHRKA